MLTTNLSEPCAVDLCGTQSLLRIVYGLPNSREAWTTVSQVLLGQPSSILLPPGSSLLPGKECWPECV